MNFSRYPPIFRTIQSNSLWIGSIILASILLAMAMMGGTWGLAYSASANVDAAPVIITPLVPSQLPAGSAATLLVINGSNFGTLTDTRVRLTGVGFDKVFTPDQISSTQIRVSIPATLLSKPGLYILTVMKSPSGTIPTIPTIPIVSGDLMSNQVLFTVYGAQIV